MSKKKLPKPQKVTEFEKVLAIHRRSRLTIRDVEDEAVHVFELLVAAQSAAKLLFEERATPDIVIAIYDRMLDDHLRMMVEVRQVVEQITARGQTVPDPPTKPRAPVRQQPSRRSPRLPGDLPTT